MAKISMRYHGGGIWRRNGATRALKNSSVARRNQHVALAKISAIISENSINKRNIAAWYENNKREKLI